MSTVGARVTITHPTGLHARPAVAMTKLAKGFSSALQVRPLPNGAAVDAKSIVKVMGLKCRTGTELEVTGDGHDAEAAVAALVDLVRRNFDEAAA
jgi:phosphocarrier protein HPr